MNTSNVSTRAAVSAAAVMALAACSSSGGGGASEPEQQAVRIVADDASWVTSGISTLEAGWVTFTMQTLDGDADHGLALLRLKGDATMDDALRAESLAEFETMVHPIGGLVGLTGAASHSVTVRLAPGSYGMFDFGESAAGPNMERGMAASFEVAAGDGVAGVEPSPDGEIVMREFEIEVPDGFTGRGTYLVRNAGSLHHELNVGRVAVGADVTEEVRRDAETGESGITEVPGVWVLGPGDAAYLELDLDAGSYVLTCNLADPEDQPVHAVHGMYAPFTVD
jgi:hypothetical protein